MYQDARPAVSGGTRTLPARYYTDPTHFERELERIHLSGWLWAGRLDELPASGHYLLVELAGESVMVLRGNDGALQGFYNVCRHRGTRLCVEPRGVLAGRIQCPYHAWTYRYDGTLASAPMMDKTEGFCRDDYPLVPVAVDTWDGHVFVHLGRDPEPLRTWLDDLPSRFAPWGMGDLRRAYRIVYPVRANWKLIIQNYSECLHCPLLHPQLQALSHYMSGDNAPSHPSYLGGQMDLRPGVTTLTEDGTSPWAPLPGLGADQRGVVSYFALLPNLLLNLHPDFMVTFALWPRAHDRTDIVCEWHFHRDEMAQDGFDPGPAVRFWDETNRQDWQVSEQAQQGIGSRAYVPGPYSNREELLVALDRWVVERVG